MTVATNIASVASNWSHRAVGSGELNRGHSDTDPSSACDGNEEYVDTDCSNSGGEADYTQKRTHTLSNGAVVWDLSANVWEWTSYVISDNSDKPYASSDGSPQAAWREYTAIDSGFTSMAQSQLIPTHALKSFWDDDWNSSQSIGQYYTGTSGSGGALLRGASWYFGANAGVFTVSLDLSPSYARLSLRARVPLSLPSLGHWSF